VRNGRERNGGNLRRLARHLRVRLELADVAKLIDVARAYDAILLDVDNGPEASPGGNDRSMTRAASRPPAPR